MNSYFDDYRKFKSTHNKYIKDRGKITEIDSQNNFSIKELKNLVSRIKYGPKKNIKSNVSIKINKPYVLFLMSKNNQWYNTYADQDLLDIPKIIYSIHKCINNDYNLILKVHPHITSDDVIDRIASTNKL